MKANIQLSHSDHEQSETKFPLSLIANDLSSPLNVGSLFRLSDALGIDRLYLCGDTPVPPNSKIRKTSRSTEKHVAFEHHADAETLLSTLRESGCLIISLEITSSSLAINSTAFKQAINNAIKNGKQLCLVLGSENSGVNPILLSLSDITTHIPMYGHNSSMNVVSATSIACFEIIKNLL